jgi:hypothetical protein
MSRSTARVVILITGLITALVHLIVLNLGGLQPLFLLNGLAYLVLLALFFWNPSFVAGRRRLLHYAFLAFTVVTIVAFLFLGNLGNILGWLTKADEVILVLALWADMNGEQSGTGSMSNPAE